MLELNYTRNGLFYLKDVSKLGHRLADLLQTGIQRLSD